MRTSRSLLFCLFLTAAAIGLVETDVIEFQNNGVHAQTDEISEILLRAILNQVKKGQYTLKNTSSELESGQETLLLNDFMLLKNNIDGEVIAVRPDTKLMINEDDNVFQFKSHNPNENTIIVTAGSNLQLEYKLSKINSLKIVLAEDYLHPTNQASGSTVRIIGGLTGSLLGSYIASISPSSDESSLILGGCILGMLATTVAPNASVSDPAVLSDSWKEIHLAQWSVWSPE